ncbi:hypothetical protein ACP70R_029684 [Stipagrostis hirtigluma subsp. patula]
MASPKATAIVASALLLALVFLSSDDGVEGFCIKFQAPDRYACHSKRGLKECASKCEAIGYLGGYCEPQPDGKPGDCYCVNCDQPPAAPENMYRA